MLKVFKDLFTIIAYTILSIIFISCGDSDDTEYQDRFALYLLKNDTVTTIDVQDSVLADIELKDMPSITYDDIIAYQKEDHKVYLNEYFSRFFVGDTLRIFSYYFGKPFVLIANDERIYLGSFISGLSSWAPDTPQILDYAIDNSEKSFIIFGAPIYNESTFVDVRNDKRIFKALKDKIIE